MTATGVARLKTGANELRRKTLVRIGSGLCSFYSFRYDRIYKKYAKERAVDGSIYVHIPKTGGLALCEALGISVNGHYTISEQERAGGRSHKIIVSIREPLERFLSIWRFSRTKSQRMVTSPLFLLRRFDDINTFVRSAAFDAFVQYHYFFRPQTYFLKGLDTKRHELIVIRQETLSSDAYREIGVRVPQKNLSPRVPTELTLESRAKIQEVYACDYREFYPNALITKLANVEKTSGKG